ncbi:MAG: Gfo/Idh/MocA family oxidoreductase [Deltaproteobacteria bacterium]|nr:Gfo/Idh/MocA family oxidoreductase [Deltaproteobacteria bacterium]
MDSKSSKVAVIGTGYWGKNLVRNFNDLGMLQAICDTDSATLSQFSKTYPHVMAVLNPVEILNNSQINAVAIATPAETHANLVRECLLAGKDVYVEKPLCLSEDEGEELNRLAAEKDRILMVGHLLWYHPAILTLKEMINKGELGKILYIYSNRLNLGKLRREENVLWSFAPHDISVILGLLSEMPERIIAQGANYLHQKIADVTISALDFPSGVQAHLFVSWLHPVKEQKLVVVGQEKMAVFDDTAPWKEKLSLFPHTITWEERIPVAHKADAELVEVQEDEPLRLECQHFRECIQTRQTPRTDGEEALRVLKVLKACQAALESGEPVTLDQKGREKKADYFVHETAVIDPDVEIGRGCKIWHFSHILPGSRLGDRVNVGQNAVIGPNVTIGSGCKIQNNVSIYESVTLEDDVFCGPSMVFTNVINPRAHISRKHEFKPTLVKRGATIGANATIVCGHTLGKYCMVGAGSIVTKDVPDFALFLGNPAEQKGWMCACGERLPENLICPACDSVYQLNEEVLEPKA